MTSRALISLAAASILIAVAGCHISVDKSKSGDEKNVKIETPLGGLHVRSDQTSAADVGLPAYTGAHLSTGSDGDKSADVHLGFGQWQLRVRAVTYETSDSQDKVVAFYKSALGRYGDVLQCDGKKAVGSPTVTHEGLTCDEEHGKGHVNVDLTSSDHLSLMAGSRHHQHIFAIKNGGGADTRFSLVELQLPGGGDQESSSSD